MRVGWRNEKPNCPFKITKLPFLNGTIAAFKKRHYMVENNWMLRALKNGLNTDHSFQFTFSQKKRKRKGKSSKNRLKWSYGPPTVAHPLRVHQVGWWFFLSGQRSILNRLLCDTKVETVWCRECGSFVSQRIRHTGASVRGVCNDMSL